MARLGRKKVRPGRVTTAVSLGAIGLFVISHSAGIGSWSLGLAGAAMLVLCVALLATGSMRAGEKAFVAGTVHVVKVSEPPLSSEYGRCEMQVLVDAPGHPGQTVVIRDPKVPVAKWPEVGGTLPALVSVSDVRRVKIQWSRVASMDESYSDSAYPASSQYSRTPLFDEEAAYFGIDPHHYPEPNATAAPHPDDEDLYADYRDDDPVDLDRPLPGAMAGPVQLPRKPRHLRDDEPEDEPAAVTVIDGDFVEGDPVEDDVIHSDISDDDVDHSDVIDGDVIDGDVIDGDVIDGDVVQGEVVSADVPAPRTPSADEDGSAAHDVQAADGQTSDPQASGEAADFTLLDFSSMPEPAAEPTWPGPVPHAATAMDVDDLLTVTAPARPASAGSINGVGVTILVTDLARSLEFYRDLLGFYEIDSGTDNVVLASGDTRLVLRATEVAPVNRRLLYVNLEVHDLNGVYQELKVRGTRFTYGPRVVNQGERLELWAAAFRDPDGHGIAITQWKARQPAQA